MTAASGSTPPVQPLNLVDSSSSAFATATKSRSARSTPRASISLMSPGFSAPYEQPPPSEDILVLEEAQRTLDGGDDAAELKEALRKVLRVADKMVRPLFRCRSTTLIFTFFRYSPKPWRRYEQLSNPSSPRIVPCETGRRSSRHLYYWPTRT